jgi:endonuclease/exonuclease/phosphatase family metal-dependent hydrolase
MNRRDAVKTTLAALGGLALTSSVANSVSAQENKSLRLRILSYNIQIGRGPGGDYNDPSQAHLDRTAAVVSAAKPDVVGLQEVDNKTNRSGSDVDQLGEIAKMTSFIPTFVSKIELPGGLYGVGVLSKEKPLSTTFAYIKGSSHRRVLAICEFERFYFFNTHFPLTAETRIAAVKVVNEEADKRRDKPIFFLGDLNAEPTSAEIKELKETWTQISPDGPTYPADDPKVQIDYIFVRNADKVVVHEARIVDDPSTSDHRPVFCDVEISAK